MNTDTAATRTADLSFIASGKWAPERSGDYDQDCRQGRRYAAELLWGMMRSGNPALLGGVLALIVGSGEFGGVEAGFCSKIGCALAA